MDHNINVEKFGVRLRPVRLQDAGFIVRLRNSPHTAGFIGDSASDEAAQQAWLERYLTRDNDYYFIAERLSDGVSIGTIGLYDLEAGRGEWGRWVVIPGQRAGPGSLWLVLHIGFDLLGLEAIQAHVVERNQRVVDFQKKIGNPCLGLVTASTVIAGSTVHQFLYRATKKDWPSIAMKLQTIALKREDLLRHV